MTLAWAVAIFLIIHVVICVLVYILSMAGVLKCSRLSAVIALLVPVWGILCTVILEVKTRHGSEASREVDIEKMLTNDEIHRSILMDEDAGADTVVPLEEALLVNDVSTRRELMMDVMYADPGDYVSQLQSARMNDDTEVVHYAVTALVELQKEYDIEFQRLERILALDPDDGAALSEITSLTERYLESGLVEGNLMDIQLVNYSGYLEKKLEKTESVVLRAKKAAADLKLREFGSAYEGILKMIELWPRDERGYLLFIKYFALVKDRAGIDHVLKMISENNVYLSPSGRGEVSFWAGSPDYSEKAASV